MVDRIIERLRLNVSAIADVKSMYLQNRLQLVTSRG